MYANYIHTSKKAPLSASGDYYLNGADDRYPLEVKDRLDRSVTGTSCRRICSRYIYGRGIANGSSYDNDILQDISLSVAEQGGAYINVSYNGALVPSNIKVLPYEDCRIGKSDSSGYSGKVLYASNFNEATTFQKFDTFNSNKEVVRRQIKAAGGIRNYKGQVLFVSLERRYTYPLPLCNSVFPDLESEHNVSLYKSSTLSTGFMGKIIFATLPMVDSINEGDENLSDDDKRILATQVTERDEFEGSLQGFMGAANAGGVLHVEIKSKGGDISAIDKEFKVIQIPSNIDDKMFAHTAETCETNIAKAFLFVPRILIGGTSPSMFGDSGALLKQAQLYYASQVKDIQDLIARGVWGRIYGKKISINPILTDDVNSTHSDN